MRTNLMMCSRLFSMIARRTSSYWRIEKLNKHLSQKLLWLLLYLQRENSMLKLEPYSQHLTLTLQVQSTKKSFKSSCKTQFKVSVNLWVSSAHTERIFSSSVSTSLSRLMQMAVKRLSSMNFQHGSGKVRKSKTFFSSIPGNRRLKGLKKGISSCVNTIRRCLRKTLLISWVKR